MNGKEFEDYMNNLPQYKAGDLVQVKTYKKYPIKKGEKFEYVVQPPKFEYVGLDESNPLHCLLKIIEEGTWFEPYNKVGDVVSFHREWTQLAG